LSTQETLGVPAIVKHDEHGFNSMRISHSQELIHAVFEVWGILLPYQRVQEHSNNLETDACSISEFAVDGWQIECLGLPHF
jgi:hypothetical protein